MAGGGDGGASCLPFFPPEKYPNNKLSDFYTLFFCSIFSKRQADDMTRIFMQTQSLLKGERPFQTADNTRAPQRPNAPSSKRHLPSKPG